eukprot:TRINITY_DN75095_c0_g1_i1.p1 TRINITY_DN75095_c0_g1~~TRINITY_DN75095_c0_g1_i1.p1  ORF type:complete len:239 (+),score=44.27 TRINITY_DN75095_c0_g1_i1:203-919(+)
MRCSSLFLFVVNTVFMVMGAVVVGLGAWGVKHKSNIKDAVPDGGVDILLSVGVFLMLTSLVGCIGAHQRTSKCGRCLLVLYAIVLSLILVLDIAAAAVFFSVTGKLHNDKLSHDVDKWISRTYSKCCDSTTHEPIDRGCWLSGDHKVVNTDTCQSEEAFKDELTHWLHKRLTPIAAVLAVVAALQLISIAVTAYLIHVGRKKQRQDADRKGNYGYFGVGEAERGAYRAPLAGQAIGYE